MRHSFLGLDLTATEARPTVAVGLDNGLQVTFLDFVTKDPEILSLVKSLNPEVVAIDAPLFLPQGMCCLEKTCPCSSPVSFRTAELALRKLGIGCFYTNKKSIIKRMVYRGMRLKGQLSQQGYPALEVYPYATKLQLWGRPIPKKTTPQGLAFLRENLAPLIPGLRPYLPQINHDIADAALAAYTAYLHSQGQAELIGSPEDGQICIPVESGNVHK